MRILAVTSFAADMLSSGTRLIESVSRRLDADLLVCHENLNASAIPAGARVRLFDLRESDTLRTWLIANADVIPGHLGGTATACDCPAVSPFQGHVAGCHWFWFNRNASRWFRKLAALEIAFQRSPYDSILWLDADCRIKKQISSDAVGAWFADASVFYLKSPFRESIESGILGIKTDVHGSRFLNITLERFMTGAFRNDPRWDDGFQFQVTLREHPDIPAVDLATRVTAGSYVLPNSPLARFFSHNKGAHRRGGVMA